MIRVICLAIYKERIGIRMVDKNAKRDIVKVRLSFPEFEFSA